jgi:hypothetical protein
VSNYTKSTNFATKDNLSSGDPLKIVKGTEIDTEFNNIATAIATKTDNASAAITGGTIVGITDLAVADGGTGASTAADARTNLSAAKSGANSDITSLSGLTTALSVAQGGTGATSITSGALVKGAGTGAFAAASASDIVGQIGSTAVTNATNASNASTVTTITTSQVLAAIAGASVGSIGTYAMVEYATAGSRTLNPGDVVNGSDLRYSGVQTHINIGFNVLDAGQYGSTLSGTWRIMGYAESNNGSNGQPATLALRIS